MGTLTIATFMTLDGVMQAPGGPDEDRDGGFEHGGWSFPYFSEDMGEVISDAFGKAECFLLGRRTYEIFAASWPNFPDKDDPVASRLNTLPKYVVSTTLDESPWGTYDNVTLIKANLADEITRLKQQPGKDILVAGSPTLVESLLQAGLLDELILLVHPVIAGKGKRLFKDGRALKRLALVDAKSTSSGVAILTYQPLKDQ